MRDRSEKRSAYILIVEDSDATSSAMSEALRDAGYRVHVANGLAETRALCHALRAPPLLALVDFYLRDGTGEKVYQELQTKWPTLSVVFCSSLRPDECDLLRSALYAPATSLLSKPFSLDQLVDTVQQLDCQ